MSLTSFPFFIFFYQDFKKLLMKKTTAKIKNAVAFASHINYFYISVN